MSTMYSLVVPPMVRRQARGHEQVSEIKDGDWKGFRRVARRYQRELRGIRDATACDADQLRWFAAAALKKRKSA